jgi:stage III sporulation protein SpoIIIAA|tara:strand:- start:740 stop:2095 length:1356 start_codon:yes stop_codon:yes gene_type:complete
MIVDEDLDKLIENLPFFIRDVLYEHPKKDQLIEIIMDLGRRPEARFITGPEYLSQKLISWQDLDYTTKRIGKFSDDNRAGIERTLHRISCIRNRQFIINGLTCRVGRAIFGTISGVRDLLESGQSILVLGKPGVGKTTMIREIARVLSDEMEKRVIVIDTSNEIAGDSDIPHSGIGRARRMQVSKTELQHQIMIEAIENHMPEVIIIDEIGTELESLAARTIAERGVQLVGTAHGNCLKNLIKNPPLADLIGGIQYVTLSDEEAKRRGTQKSILERKAYPAFQVAIEINQRDIWTIHENVEESVDLLLQGQQPILQIRELTNNSETKIKYGISENNPLAFFNNQNTTKPWKNISTNLNNRIKDFSIKKTKTLKIYPYSISTDLILKAAKNIGFKVIITKEIDEATIILGLKKHLLTNVKLKQNADIYNINIYSVNNSTVPQITQILYHIVK